MKDFQDILKKGKYKKIKFRLTRTNHLQIKASINGVKGRFILDTGASSSCVGIECVELFFLKAKDSSTKAAGAGGTGMITQLARKNTLKIGSWLDEKFDIVVFDMSHVNEALREHKAEPVNGIIGADVLLKGKAIIDYSNSVVYLKK